MRRIAPALLAILALAGSATAAPRSGISDPRGDWPVASQDVVSAKLSSVLVSGKPVLRGELQLAAAPDGRPATYAIGFAVGCHAYSFDKSTEATGDHVALSYTDYCTPEDDGPGRIGVDKEYPATVSVKGRTVTWLAPYVGQIKRGARVEGMSAWGCARLCTSVGIDWNDQKTVGDLAWGEMLYVVGSDLPRR
jgi:hypothetical protein